jgi:serine protease Do
MRTPRVFKGIVFGLVLSFIASASAAERDPYEAVIEVADLALPAVVGLHAFSPSGSAAAQTLGEDRRGTGFIIDPAGLILTSNHVVVGAREILVTLTDGRSFPAKVLGSDATKDLAILRVKAEGLPSLPLGRSDDLRLGQGVIVVGSNHGSYREVTVGTINAIRPFVGHWEFMLERVIQTDALVQLGYSGGPLLNISGEVVGVVSFLRPTIPGPAGLVVPIEEASTIRKEALYPDHGMGRKARRAWLGTIALAVAGRVAIQRLTPGGPAMRANLKPKDLITHVNATPISGLEEYYREIWKHPPGAEIRLTIEREGKTLLVVIQSADRNHFFEPSASE